MKIIYQFASLTLAILFFVLTNPVNIVNAQEIFYDTFNGSGELHAYNPSYEKVTSFNQGTMTVNADHVEATGFDPAYVYTAIPGENICASIDFNWANGGAWTGIMLRTTPNEWNDEVQVRIDNGVTNWVFYRNASEIGGSGSIAFNPAQNNTLKTCISGSDVTAYLNGLLFFSGTASSSNGGYVGFASQFGTQYLDNFRLEREQQAPIILNVPLLKQTSNPWRNQAYDSARAWNPQDPYIKTWGCALTSAAMVFNYHKINKLPDGKILDPGTLDSWLKKQKDGYVGNGLVNWLALSRLSKQAKNINNLTYNALEFTKTIGFAPDKLTDALNDELPGILGVPNHFVVGKGSSGSVFTINDPYYPRESLSEYGNTFQSLGVYTPSNTDLSYVMLVTSSNVEVTLKNINDDSVGESFLENEIVNPSNSSQSTGEPIRIHYLPKPTDDNYQIVLASTDDTSYELKIYLYDLNGEVFTHTQTGNLQKGSEVVIPLTFNGQANLYPTKVTFVSTLVNIEKAYKQKQITKATVKKQLEETLARAFLQKLLKNEERELKFLIEFEEILSQNQETRILEPAYSKLLYDINYLSTHL